MLTFIKILTYAFLSAYLFLNCVSYFAASIGLLGLAALLSPGALLAFLQFEIQDSTLLLISTSINVVYYFFIEQCNQYCKQLIHTNPYKEQEEQRQAQLKLLGF